MTSRFLLNKALAFFISFLTLMPVYAQDIAKPFVPISSFINNETLACNINENASKFYALMGLLSAFDNNFPYSKNAGFKLGQQKVLGIDNLEIKQNEEKDGTIKQKIIKIHTQKYGLDFQKIATFSPVLKLGNAEILGNGYYFMVAGSAKNALLQLHRHHIETDSIIIMETTEKQTKISCFISG